MDMKQGETIIAAPRGDSMFPLVLPNDVLYFRSYSANHRFAVGDIVFFKSKIDNNIVCHRVISTHGKTITTKGDNRTATDAPRNASEIFGVLVGVQRNGRYLDISGSWGKFYASLDWLLVDIKIPALHALITGDARITLCVRACKKRLFTLFFTSAVFLS